MQPWPYPFWLAHRGAGKIAPENTLAAFRTGASLGFRGFECDVKLSADGVLYLLHDDDLDRTTNAVGPAKGRSWQDLSHLDAGSWLGAEFAGEPPASLDAIAKFCDKNHLAVNLEIKPCPGMEEPTGQAVARWVAQHWPRSSPPPLLSSFEVATLKSAQAQAANLPRALLLERLGLVSCQSSNAACSLALKPDGVVSSRRHSPSYDSSSRIASGLDGGAIKRHLSLDTTLDWLATALELGCCAVVLEHTQVSQEAITQAHAQGLRVLAYTVNDLGQAQRLRGWGIDGLITDNMGLSQR